MKNNLYSIDINTLSADGRTFGFHIDRTFFEYFENEEVHDADCNVDIAVEKGAGMTKLDISISGSVTVECDRCLEDVAFPVDYSEPLYIKVSNSIEESYLDLNGDEEILWITPQDAEIDMRQYLYDSIMLSLPLQRVHGEDENGVSMCDPEVLKKIKFE